MLASQLKSVSENFRALTDQVSESSKTLKQILIWLRGSTNEDGEFEPGLIEQNKRQQVVIKRAVKWGLGFLGTIATSAVGLLFLQIAHTVGLRP